jgi:hypothetical protein
LSSMILSVFLENRSGEAGGHQQENHSRDFQPELVQGAAKGSGSGAGSRHQGIEGAAALHLLAGNAGHHSSFAPVGNFTHALDFTSLRRYNDPTRERRTVRGIMASKKLVGELYWGPEWIHN